METSSAIFPQRISADTPAGAAPAPHLVGPARFTHGEHALFLRPWRVTEARLDGATLHLVCTVEGFLNRSVNTHETRMHQFLRTEVLPDTLHVAVHAWAPHIFRVRYALNAPPSDTEPAFPPPAHRMLIGTPSEPHVTLTETPDGYTLTTPEYTLHIAREPFTLRAVDADGRVFWEQRRSELFTADIFPTSLARQGDARGAFEAFTLGGQETIYGLGERFDHLARNGVAVDFWNKDAIGTSNTRTYINVPFLLSTRGYGLFVNTSARTEWQVGTLDAATLGFGIADDAMDYFIIHGPTPAEILHRYATLTGFAPTPPVWSFGLWMSRNSYLSWEVVEEVAADLRRREIPADVLHLDTAWFHEDWNCDLRFSEERFPDPAGHMARLKDDGFRISLWQYNYVPPRADNVNYVEGLAKGYFATGADGKPYRLPDDYAGAWLDDAVIDFSNPDATAWYTAQIADLIRLGAATIKTDFGEGIPEDAHYHGIDGARFHNLYSLVYNAAMADAIAGVSGEHIVWARSGTAGSQRYPVHWGGDSQCEWAGLAGTVRAALSMGLSGFPYFSHDIGGFIGRPTPELYVRWAQVGMFSSHARCHGCGNDNSREPWSFGEEACEIFTAYAKLRYRLLPYIYHHARLSASTALPLLRALVLDYPDDMNVRRIDDQYLFGDAFMVAPVLEPLADATTRTLYLPTGTWYDYWTQARIDSHGQWITRPVDLATMPLYVKAGSLIPYGEDRQSTHNAIGPIARLDAYAGADGVYGHAAGRRRDGSRNTGVSPARGDRGGAHPVLIARLPHLGMTTVGKAVQGWGNRDGVGISRADSVAIPTPTHRSGEVAPRVHPHIHTPY
jgi:alpha-D-xyloside xylohydrolase